MPRYLSHVGFWLNGLHRVPALPYCICLKTNMFWELRLRDEICLRMKICVKQLWRTACADLGEGCGTVGTLSIGIWNEPKGGRKDVAKTFENPC